jgi:tetratricopeptide (TPR) repeat protein
VNCPPVVKQVERTLCELSSCCQAIGNYEEALCLLQEALQIKKTKYGDNHEETLSTMRRMGQLYNRWDKYEEAEECLREALGIAEAASLTRHVEVALVMSEMGHCYANQGKFTESEQYYKHALKVKLDWTC